MRAFAAPVLAVALALGAPLAAQQQDQTLADIRQQLTVLFVEVQRLRREFSTTGAPDLTVAGNTPLDRLGAIETELRRLTAKTEELEFRIDRITRDGTNRIGDLEFRLCELEEGCDIAALGDTPSLGGIDNEVAVPRPAPAPEAGGPDLAVGERADFDAALAAFEAGEFRTATELFAAFTETYPGGPLSPDAHYLRGEAFESLGEMSNAARAYLDAFSGAPAGTRAPDALFKLGSALASLGQTQDACITLGEVGARFPGSEASFDAETAMRSLACP